MFAIVKHENGELKINPNCYIRIIYNYIQEQLSIPPDREFDLLSEDGSPCFIYRHPPDTDGMTILKPRQTYTLEMLRVDGNGEGSVDPDEVAKAEDEEHATAELVTKPSSHGSDEDLPQDAVE